MRSPAVIELLLFSFVFFKKGDLAQGRPRDCMGRLASIVVGTRAALHFSAVTQSFGSPQFIPWEEKRLSLHWLCLFCCGADRTEPSAAVLRAPSALIHVSSQVSDASNLYSRWLHNYILEQIRLRLTGFWTCRMCASFPFCFSYF